MHGDDGLQAGCRVAAKDHAFVIVKGGIAEDGHDVPAALLNESRPGQPGVAMARGF